MEKELRKVYRERYGRDMGEVKRFDASSDTDIKDIEKNSGKAGAITIVTNR